MYIPTPLADRAEWMQDTLQQLRLSMAQRRSRYATWNTWYLYGGAEWGARYNKIKPTLNTLAGYLFAPRSVRFSFNLGPVARAASVELLETASDRLRALWSTSGADSVFSAGTLGSLVQGKTIPKFAWRDGAPECHLVQPGNFAVWRDDLPTLEGQQAMLHTYRMDPATVRGWLVNGGMSEEEAGNWIRYWGNRHPEGGDSGSIIVGQQNPINWTGGATSGYAGAVQDWGNTSADYSANSETPTLKIEELWAWDDRARDWRIFQVIENDMVLSDRANDFLPKRHAFVDLAVDPLQEYFWSFSVTNALIPLQAWREKRMNQLDKLFARQASPPGVMSGFMGGVQDEKFAAVMRRGGLLANSQNPGAKVELLTPQVNSLSFTEIAEIDRMFMETAGLSGALTGETTGNPRGGKQTGQMMSAGASMLTDRMMNVEHAVASGAELLMELTKRYDPTILVDDDQNKYIMKQVPEDAVVEVAAHSASPVFAEMALSQAERMRELGIIDDTDFLDIADPPFAQALKQRLRQRAKNQSKKDEQMVQETPAADRWRLFQNVFGGRSKTKA